MHPHTLPACTFTRSHACACLWCVGKPRQEGQCSRRGERRKIDREKEREREAERERERVTKSYIPAENRYRSNGSPTLDPAEQIFAARIRDTALHRIAILITSRYRAHRKRASSSFFCARDTENESNKVTANERSGNDEYWRACLLVPPSGVVSRRSSTKRGKREAREGEIAPRGVQRQWGTGAVADWICARRNAIAFFWPALILLSALKRGSFVWLNVCVCVLLHGSLYPWYWSNDN